MDLEKNNWRRQRVVMAQFHNAHYKSQKKATDFAKFPEDDEIKEEEKPVSTRLTPEEVEQKFNKRGKQ